MINVNEFDYDIVKRAFMWSTVAHITLHRNNNTELVTILPLNLDANQSYLLTNSGSNNTQPDFEHHSEHD